MAFQRNVQQLGQVFTPDAIVQRMLGLRRNRGRTLEPSAGAGAFCSRLEGEVTAIEVDGKVAPDRSLVMDFFAYPLDEKFDTIIGNPPYVRHQDILPATKALLSSPLFDGRSNLYLYFIEKCVRHLKPGGELIFIVPREFTKLTAARRLNEFLYQEGSITDFIETGDAPLFEGAGPNCAIFRFERGRFDRRMHDGRIFTLVAGQLMFLGARYTVPLASLFDVKVGAVSGADELFEHPQGNAEFVYSKTIGTGKTRRMLFQVAHPDLLPHKERLLRRRVRHFDETNWWAWGRLHHMSPAPRIYVNAKTRRPQPFFVHPCPNYDGSILALFPVRPLDLARAVALLNGAVNWQELGFVCDGRFLFSQRSLQTCLLPEQFAELWQAPHPCLNVDARLLD